jgi:thiol-disulfide isomerase/thioredoxin
MNKLLLTCFLALLCLVGRYFTASSKVVRSPGAELLHRSDSPNRGGAILPDTFPRIDFGLVDSDQDTEVGMDEEHIHSTSVPVFPSQNKQEVGRQAPESQSLVSSVACAERSRNMLLDTHNGLVDSDQGMGAGEEASSFLPAPPESFRDPVTDSDSPTSEVKVSQMTRFHIELPNTTAPDTLRLTYWDQFLKEHNEVTPGTSIDLIAERGSFFEGNAGYKVYRWDVEDLESYRVFSIRMGQHHLVRYWNMPPGAQVKVRMELNGGVTYFWGPSSRFFKAQQEVDRLAAELSWQESPLMVTNNPERMLSDSLVSLYHQKSLSLPEVLYRPMFFVVAGKTDRELLETYLVKPIQEYSLIKQASLVSEGLPDTSRYLLMQRAYGETLRLLVSKLKLGRTWLQKEPYLSRFETILTDLPIPTADQELDPVFVSAIYELVLLKGAVDNVPLTQVLESYPSTLSDRVLGLYLLDNFKRLEENQNKYLADVLREVELPWIQDLILDLKSRSLSGNPLMAPPLTDLEGKAYDLTQLDGKAVVVSFWITGCRFCMRYYQNTLKEVYEQWSDRDEVVFVSVNADPNPRNWKESVASELYSHPEMIQLHQDAGSGILADLRISTFPQKLLITPDQKILLLTTTQYTSDQLSEKIGQLLAAPKSSQESKNTSF